MFMEIPPGADLSQIAFIANPDGSPPNFVDPPSLKAVTCAVIIILMVISFLMVLFRIRMNLKGQEKFTYDDYFCIVAWILATVYGAIVISATPTARHAWDVPLGAIDASWVKRSAVLGTIYGPAMWFAKTAILTMYLRAFGIVRWMWWCCHTGIAFLFCAYWSLVPVSVTYNFPLRAHQHWDLALSLSSTPAQLPFVIMGLISVVSDLYILILPFPILLKLHVSRRRKIGLCLVFATAAIGIVSSCLVLYFRVVLWKNMTQDATWYVASSYLTVAVEINVAVIISCVPAAAASWKLFSQESRPFLSLRSAFKSSRNLIHVASGSNLTAGKMPKPYSGIKLASLESVGARS
ncbi:uncharacterized protein F4807DRAFT_460448 [Annulohypoxylon truncatum]|uniref:uncharacterized protein n=1 Tax=Annulohypoxylon truncatum TaxID=327061 RepID=UPI002007BE2C|nr:uncharacterized protein F4807DRAFT_460448 [Annulohypoxylon truncatum]KAI1209701.1 hypothetical protein F4807DRAFT_460448 [Annulohypoxylon truncatum]